jgi:hypothetical protein
VGLISDQTGSSDKGEKVQLTGLDRKQAVAFLLFQVNATALFPHKILPLTLLTKHGKSGIMTLKDKPRGPRKTENAMKRRNER